MRILDLFCGAGGCSVGYARAGFDVVGVDIEPQSRYPFLDVIQDDALAVLSDASFVAEFEAIHASPPCQRYSVTAARWNRRDQHADLVGPIRDLLKESGKPYVIENVVGAPLVDPIILCGSMWGLGIDGATLKRHRLFESNIALSAPPDACKGRKVVGVYGHGRRMDAHRSWWRRREGLRRRCGKGTRHRLDGLPASPGPSDPACLHRAHRPPAHGPHRERGRRMTTRWTCAIHGPTSTDCRGCDDELIALAESERTAEKDAPGIDHGKVRAILRERLIQSLMDDGIDRAKAEAVADDVERIAVEHRARLEGARAGYLTDLSEQMDAADESDEARWADVDAMDVEGES